MTKRAVILHGLKATSQSLWFPWLKNELEAHGYDVWVPDLPHPERPDAKAWTDFVLEYCPWSLHETLLIGHSAGAIGALQLLARLNGSEQLRAAVLCSATNHTDRDEPKSILIPPIDLVRAKRSCPRLLFVHGDDDQRCPIQGAKTMARDSKSQLIVVPGGQHFLFKEFPQLMEILEQQQLL